MKKTLFKTFIVLISIVTVSGEINAQFGAGLTFSNDLYNRYANPTDGIAHNGNGSVILNLGLGPKFWVGGENFSLSLESQAVIGFFGLSVPDTKGLGNFAVPVLANFNFAGVSGLNKEGRFGLSVGGGMQFNRTELYWLGSDYRDRGVERSYFRTYVVQLGYGFGISGFAARFIVRYGFNPDLDGANSLNIGMQYDFNFRKLKQIDDPASRL